MLLMSVKELRERVNVKDAERYNIVLADLIITASSAIAAHLNTSFKRKTVLEQFYVDPSNYRTNNPHALYLYLKGFNPTDIKVQAVGSYANQSVSSPLAPERVRVDENAILTIVSGWTQGQYINVSYESGFDTVTEGTNEIYQGVPELIKTACALYCEHMFTVKFRSGAVYEDGLDQTSPPHAVLVLLGDYDRYAQHALRAI